MLVAGVKITLCIANRPVTALPFPSFQLFKRAMHTNTEQIVILEQLE